MAVALVGVVGTAASTTSPLTGAYGQAPTANNVLVARVTASAVTSVTQIAIPTGWARAFDVVAAATTTAVFTKVAAGSDAAPSFASTLTGTASMSAVIDEYSGADTTTPVDPGFNSYSGTTATAVALTVLAAVGRAGGRCLTMFSARRNTAVAVTGPPGTGFTSDYTNGASLQRNHAYGDHQTAAPSAGSSPSESFTYSSAQEVQSGVIFVVQPPGVAVTLPELIMAPMTGA